MAVDVLFEGSMNSLWQERSAEGVIDFDTCLESDTCNELDTD